MTILRNGKPTLQTNDVTTYAAVDLGSNSFHLLLARKVDGRFEVLHKEKQRVYLAAGLDAKNHLDDDAIERAVDILRQFAVTLADFSPSNVKVVATYTLRRARNVKRFMQRVRAVFPFHIDIISGQEEARLIYQGVAQHVHHDEQRLVIDIGGGSTELVIGEHHQHRALSSRNMGCVSFSQQFFKDGKITQKRFNRAIVRAEQELESISNTFSQLGWQHVLATSGTAKTLCAICHEGDLNNPLTLECLRKLMKTACDAGHIEELPFTELPLERRATFCGGLAILIAIMQNFAIEELQYCDYSLREGLLHELQEKLSAKDIRQSTIENLSQRYVVDTQHAANICSTLEWLYPQLKDAWHLDDPELLSSLMWAAQLHEVGLSINSSGLHKHSAYIIANTQLPGFTQEQQHLLVMLIRFHRKKVKLREMPEFIELPSGVLYRLIALFRLAALLNRKRQGATSTPFNLAVKANSLHLSFKGRWLKENSLFAADLDAEQEQWKKLGLTLKVS